MNLDWSLITSLIFNITFLIIIISQYQKIAILRNENEKSIPNETNDELIAIVSEKIKSIGDIKTVKYLREEKGMSMLDAKEFVNIVKDN